MARSKVALTRIGKNKCMQIIVKTDMAVAASFPKKFKRFALRSALLERTCISAKKIVTDARMMMKILMADGICDFNPKREAKMKNT